MTAMAITTTQLVSFRIDADLLARIDLFAEGEGRTRSNMMARLLLEAVDSRVGKKQ